MKRTDRRGVVVPVVVAAIAVFLALLAVVVDGGLLYLGASELRTLADTAVLVAATTTTEADAVEAVADFLEMNGREGLTFRISWQERGDGAQEVRVVLVRAVSLFLTRDDDGHPAVRSVSISSRAHSSNGHVFLVP